MSREIDFTIKRLGEAQFLSPLSSVKFVRDDERILYDIDIDNIRSVAERSGVAVLAAREAAGPRKPSRDRQAGR